MTKSKTIAASPVLGMTAEDLLIRFLEEGAPLAMAERASGIPMTTLAHLPISRNIKPPTAEELGEMAAKVARMAMNSLMDQMETGGPAIKLRAATAIVGAPLRRMTTDASSQMDEMKSMMENMLMGQLPDAEPIVEEDG